MKEIGGENGGVEKKKMLALGELELGKLVIG